MSQTQFDVANACQRIRNKMSSTAQNSGRDINGIRLIAVSKKQSVDKIQDAYSTGIRDFGENYAQELKIKSEYFNLPDIRWVFIGQLQSNKLKMIVTHASEIQALNSLKHASLIETYAKEQSKCPYPVWINVNCENEASKGGVHLKDVEEFAHQILTTLPGLKLMGIMAIPPKTYQDSEKSSEIPDIYLQLRAIANGIGEGRLSLGMSGDMGLAIKAGSDVIRIGSDLFGKRDQ